MGREKTCGHLEGNVELCAEASLGQDGQEEREGVREDRKGSPGKWSGRHRGTVWCGGYQVKGLN